MYVMEVNIRPSFKKKYGSVSQKFEGLSTSERLANAQRDTKILNEMWLMVGIGLSIFLGGFGIWALDIKYCGTVRRWRHQIGLPWGILLEGHGWWLVYFPFLLNLLIGPQAFNDRLWSLLLSCLGSLASPLLEWETRWICAQMAKHIFLNPWGCSTLSVSSGRCFFNEWPIQWTQWTHQWVHQWLC